MYKNNPSFIEPVDEESKIWRYIDFTKFVLMLTKEALFFAGADQLSDSFEGSYALNNIKQRYQNNLSEDEIKKLRENYREERESILVNCWHMNEYESAVMWKIYSRNNQGIAIQSRFNMLKECFVCKTDIYGGKIRYIDYDRDFIDPTDNFAPFMCKRKSFDYENELRLITRFSEINSQKEPETEKRGQYFSANLVKLIEKIYVSPKSGEWFRELVEAVLHKYSINKKVVKSDLNKDPIY